MKILINPKQNIDPILRVNREPGTEFILESGTYYTRGAFGFPEHDLCMLAPECSIVGAGSRNTTIQLIDAVTEYKGKPTGYIEALTGGARTRGKSDSIRMSGFTLSLKTTSSVGLPTVGVHLWSASAEVLDVHVNHVWGSRSLPVPNEGFGILINNPHNTALYIDGGAKVSNCRVVAEAGAYATGCFVGYNKRYGRPLVHSLVENVFCMCPWSTRSHAGFGVSQNTSLVRCTADGFTRAVFCDTGDIGGITIDRMMAARVQWGLDLRASENTRIGFVDVSDSQFEFDGDLPADQWVQIFLIQDWPVDGPKEVGPVRFRGCIFTANNALASKGRASGKRVILPTIDNQCIWIGKSDWQEIVDQTT